MKVRAHVSGWACQPVNSCQWGILLICALCRASPTPFEVRPAARSCPAVANCLPCAGVRESSAPYGNSPTCYTCYNVIPAHRTPSVPTPSPTAPHLAAHTPPPTVTSEQLAAEENVVKQRESPGETGGGGDNGAPQGRARLPAGLTPRPRAPAPPQPAISISPMR